MQFETLQKDMVAAMKARDKARDKAMERERPKADALFYGYGLVNTNKLRKNQ